MKSRPAMHEWPKTHKETMSRDDAKQWKEAEEREVNQLELLKVAKLVKLPPGARLLPFKWVYEIKRTGVYKARFVARGDKQRPGSDYEQTFAQVVRPKTWRIIMALIAVQDLHTHAVDVMTASRTAFK
jgi:hypothetical protein